MRSAIIQPYTQTGNRDGCLFCMIAARVIPAQAGIHSTWPKIPGMDSRLRGNDGPEAAL